MAYPLTMKVIAILVVLVVIAIWLIWYRRRGNKEMLTAVRNKLERVAAFGQYHEYMIGECRSVDPIGVSVAEQERLLSIADINRTLNDRIGAIGSVVVTLENSAADPEVRIVNVINGSLNNIWSLQEDINKDVQTISAKYTDAKNAARNGK